MSFNQYILPIDSHTKTPVKVTETDIDIMRKIAERFGISPEAPDFCEQVRRRIDHLINESEMLRVETGTCAHTINNKVSVFLAIIGLNRSLIPVNDYENLVEATNDIIGLNRGLMRRSSITSEFLSENQLPLTDVNLRGVIEKATANFGRTNPDIKIFVQTDHNLSACVNIHGITNSIENLLLNSRKAMPNGGKIIIQINEITINGNNPLYESVSEGEYITISVKDNGCGIPEEIREKVFDPAVTTDPEDGNGFGLTSVRDVIEKHNGRVLLDSQTGDGSFTEFTMFIPKINLNAAETPRQAERKSSMPPNPVTFFSQHPSLLRESSRLIRKEGGQCNVANDINSVFEQVQVAPKGAVIIIHDNSDLAHRIRRIRPDLKIIYCGEDEPRGACDSFLPGAITPDNVTPLISALAQFGKKGVA